ncbi:MAG: aminotransferase class III-fold pyridoxal phosphate-dependent enzyme [Candidatus Pacebacteria bacterium]|nr:aminotransferase class III-fold pyridoxal phosphate-dependent enzyme [Candidatus Paceibacterota bacterium]
MTALPITPKDLDRYEVENVFHSWSFQPTVSPKRVVSAHGCRFTDETGRDYLDFSSCFVNVNIGHQHPRVVDGICKQARKLCSFAPTFSTEPRAVLAAMLANITPGDLSRTFFSLGGTEANEAAVKICHQYTGRHKIIGRYRSYHGGTAAAMSLSAGDPRPWSQPTAAVRTLAVPPPYCYRCMHGQTYPDCNLRCLKFVDEIIELEGGGDQVAGIIVEPIIGANGIIVPPPEYFPEMRRMCDKWGILLLADEVMTGFGRTGKWFALDHWDVVPDILSLSKGLTAGYVPLGATVVRTDIGNYFRDHFFGHGATYMGHALACAAAIEVLNLYEEENLIDNSATLGKYLLERSRELQDRHPCIGDVRGLGLFVGLELVRNRRTREPLVPVAGRVCKEGNPKTEVGAELVNLGMIAMAANPSNVIAMAPPLCATKSDIDEGIAIMDRALRKADACVEA